MGPPITDKSVKRPGMRPRRREVCGRSSNLTRPAVESSSLNGRRGESKVMDVSVLARMCNKAYRSKSGTAAESQYPLQTSLLEWPTL